MEVFSPWTVHPPSATGQSGKTANAQTYRSLIPSAAKDDLCFDVSLFSVWPFQKTARDRERAVMHEQKLWRLQEETKTTRVGLLEEGTRGMCSIRGNRMHSLNQLLANPVVQSHILIFITGWVGIHTSTSHCVFSLFVLSESASAISVSCIALWFARRKFANLPRHNDGLCKHEPFVSLLCMWIPSGTSSGTSSFHTEGKRPPWWVFTDLEGFTRLKSVNVTQFFPICRGTGWDLSRKTVFLLNNRDLTFPISACLLSACTAVGCKWSLSLTVKLQQVFVEYVVRVMYGSRHKREKKTIFLLLSWSCTSYHWLRNIQFQCQ